MRRTMALEERKAAFLESLAGKYTVRQTAAAAGIGRRTVYDWRDQDAEFAQAWCDAREDCAERLEETMYEKALGGETLAGFFMLKGMRPTVYRDNVRVEHSGVSVNVSLSDLPEDERRALLELALRSDTRPAVHSEPLSLPSGDEG
jgi:transposase-like protein